MVLRDSRRLSNKTVLIATHGGCMRVFLMRIGWAKYGSLRGRHVQNSGYVKVLSDGVDFLIKETKGITDPATIT